MNMRAVWSAEHLDAGTSSGGGIAARAESSLACWTELMLCFLHVPMDMCTCTDHDLDSSLKLVGRVRWKKRFGKKRPRKLCTLFQITESALLHHGFTQHVVCFCNSGWSLIMCQSCGRPSCHQKRAVGLVDSSSKCWRMPVRFEWRGAPLKSQDAVHRIRLRLWASQTEAKLVRAYLVPPGLEAESRPTSEL